MASYFKKDPKEQVRQNDRVMRKAERDMTRDRLQMERQEKALEAEIKKMAKQGDKQACTTLAKQLVNLRKQKTKSYGVSAKMTSINAQSKTMMSNAKMADAMKTTTDTMVAMNKHTDPMKIAKTMQDFEKANTKMEMSEEMISDTLDNIMAESGDEEEEDAIVNSILDEIGIDINSKMPSAVRGTVGPESSKAKITDADVEKMLADLKD